jgi:hypothetical protein
LQADWGAVWPVDNDQLASLYVCRPGIGLWNPAGGTRLILISPPGRGLPLEEISPLVDAALPEWERAVLSYLAFIRGPGLDSTFQKCPISLIS